MSMLLPVLSLYLNQLGIEEGKELSYWTGITFSVTFLIAAIVSPLWGALADRYGQKSNLMRTGIGMGILTILMAFSTSAVQLLILRIGMGVFAGFQAIVVAYQASKTPKEHLGKTLGSLATASTSAGIIGPLIGGLLAETFGLQMMFILMGIVCLLSLAPIAIYLKDTKLSERKNNVSKELTFRDVLRNSKLSTLFLSTFIYRVAFMGAAAVMTLYVMRIQEDTDNLVITVSIATSIFGIAAMIGSPLLGRLSDRIGQEKFLAGSLILSGLTLIPFFFVKTIGMLYVVRFFQGLVGAGIFPSINALMKKTADDRIFGRASGLNQSFIFLGNVLGPIIAGFVAGYSLSFIYILLGILCAIGGLVVGSKFRSEQRPDLQNPTKVQVD